MEMNQLFRKAAICIAVALPLTWLTSCGDDEEGRIEVNSSAPAKVSNVASTSGPGEVYLTWTIPASSSFMYSKVTYTNAKGEEVYKLYSKDMADENGTMKATIGGFVSTEPVEFSIYACAVRGDNSGAITYSAAPGAPAFLAVAQSLTVEPAWGGVKVGYKNETAATVFVELNYNAKGAPDQAGSHKFQVAGNSEGKQFVHLWTSDTDFINGGEALISMTAQDADGNASDEVSAECRTKKVAALDRSGWTFPGYQDSNDATIGYSSQEAGGEGPSPKGRVIAMLDGDNGTFWHTAWKTASDYPHFFIIDMGKEELVSDVSIRRRSGNNGTNTGQTIYTCTAANASGTDPNTWGWDNHGWYSFDRESDRTQLFGMKDATMARYIKVYYAASDKGGNFVMVSEFNAYTPAE